MTFQVCTQTQTHWEIRQYMWHIEVVSLWPLNTTRVALENLCDTLQIVFVTKKSQADVILEYTCDMSNCIFVTTKNCMVFFGKSLLHNLYCLCDIYLTSGCNFCYIFVTRFIISLWQFKFTRVLFMNLCDST